MRTYPRSGFHSGRTSECTLVPVFVLGEHLPKPPFGKPPFWEPPSMGVTCYFPHLPVVNKFLRFFVMCSLCDCVTHDLPSVCVKAIVLDIATWWLKPRVKRVHLSDRSNPLAPLRTSLV